MSESVSPKVAYEAPVRHFPSHCLVRFILISSTSSLCFAARFSFQMSLVRELRIEKSSPQMWGAGSVAQKRFFTQRRQDSVKFRH